MKRPASFFTRAVRRLPSSPARLLAGAAALLLAAPLASPAGPAGPGDDIPHYRVAPANIPAVSLPHARIASPAVTESSALLPSRKRPGVFWTLNDSGNPLHLHALHADGSTVGPEKGFLVPGASNTDWEALACTPDGLLVIGDIGNNKNRRRDLCLWLWPEPDPEAPAQPLPAARRLAFRYADQTDFPPPARHYDAEALFFADGALHLLTKHRKPGVDTWTTLYRFDHLDPDQPAQVLRPLARFYSGDRVTDAAITADELRLAVLTRSGVWLFTRGQRGDDFFSTAAIAWAPLLAGQCEGIAFLDAATLLVSNEGSQLFRVPLASLHPAGRATLETSGNSVP
ncbi:hypothetical protein OPIT5_20125 [Opitutaceae bacterium TAV5]|nr:hypothetical protein OPIT5_20125 [Opitutaceae bacterium TAV5]